MSPRGGEWVNKNIILKLEFLTLLEDWIERNERHLELIAAEMKFLSQNTLHFKDIIP
jgi:hypothetical protein